MRKLIFVCLVLFNFFTAAAQFATDNVTGKPYMINTSTDIQGTPFFLDEWCSGVMYLKDGHKADKFPLQLDIYSGQLLFKHNDQPMSIENEVKEFTLQPAAGSSYLFRCGYKPYDRYTAATWYMVLQDGPVSLLKQVKKVLQDKNEYNSATKTKMFVLIESWFIAKPDGTLVKIKKDKASLLEALADKKDMLNRFIEKEKLRVKNEDEMKAVVKAYNEKAGA